MNYLLAAAGLFFVQATAESPCLTQAARAEAGYALVDVNVIPMDRNRILIGQTVLVRGCRIEAVGARDSVAIPNGFVRIEGGDDVFLMPGLVDAHTHVRYADDPATYLSGGVTTVRNMTGDDRHIAWKREIAAGAFGPRIITSPGTPYDNGADDARVRAFVDSVAARGFDFLKVYDRTPANVYRVLVESGRRHNLPIAGHIPSALGLDGVLAAKQKSIEHAEQFMYHHFHSDYDRTRIPDVVSRVKSAGTAVTPTLSVIESWIAVADSPTSLLVRNEGRWVHPETSAFWNTFARTSSFENRMLDAFQRPLVAALSNAGVPLMVGTDALMVGLVGPWGVRREIAALHSTGLSRFEALRAATATPAQVLGYDAGTIAPGKLADMILVRGNPLDDLTALERLDGVMMDGRWHPGSQLNARLLAIETKYRAGNEVVRLALRGTLREGLQLQRTLRAQNDSTRLDAGTLAYVGTILRQRGRNDDAIRVYEVASEESPQSASIHENIARAHLAAGRVADAVAALERSLAIDPQRQSARALLASLR